MIDSLAKAGINTEKAILEMKFEDLDKIPNYTLKDVKTLISLRKAIKANKKALFLFLGEEEHPDVPAWAMKLVLHEEDLK